MAESRLTNSTDECSVQKLLSGRSVFSIPVFQRPYRWKSNRLEQFESDLLSLADSEDTVHFFGAIIIHGYPGLPTDAPTYEVIDGQQRLTTLFLYLCAAVKTLVDLGELETATNLFTSYLSVAQPTKSNSNITVQPSEQDRPDMNGVISSLLAHKNFGKSIAGWTFKPLSLSNAPKSSQISKNYKRACDFFRSASREGKIETVTNLYSCILQKVTIVQIDVKDPLSGPKIYNSLNSNQEPMTVGDLVRNEVFARANTNSLDELHGINEHEWRPFYSTFGDPKLKLFESYFFPFALARKPNLKKSEVFSSLRKDWGTLTPTAIINDLSSLQREFLDIVTDENHLGLASSVRLKLHKLRLLGVPASTYPFLMNLIAACGRQEVTDSECVACLDLLESFLTRRAICGFEPTGLHAVFKGLWNETELKTAEAFAKRIALHKTVTWPTNGEVQAAIKTQPMYSSSITPFILGEYNRKFEGDAEKGNPETKEHVLPQNPAEGTWKQFTAEQQKRLVHVLANLVPLSPEMQPQVGNKSYAKKRVAYMADSKYKSTRDFAERNEDWTPDALEARSLELAGWVVTRWSHERPTASVG